MHARSQRGFLPACRGPDAFRLFPRRPLCSRRRSSSETQRPSKLQTLMQLLSHPPKEKVYIHKAIRVSGDVFCPKCTPSTRRTSNALLMETDECKDDELF
ncbi:hypothetical protein CesoFtcFv8_020331 [Champsocephalus esox]|uniref:Uncharacterized protein n=1 Tax=Champsocephalus esox TaxID=159716 RepID=A0AAN8BF90_9TELE|nr:hypothetical protein CesoFtcFv8_020331 [Champsocephalus esox]